MSEPRKSPLEEEPDDDGVEALITGPKLPVDETDGDADEELVDDEDIEEDEDCEEEEETSERELNEKELERVTRLLVYVLSKCSPRMRAELMLDPPVSRDGEDLNAWYTLHRHKAQIARVTAKSKKKREEERAKVIANLTPAQRKLLTGLEADELYRVLKKGKL